MKKFKNVLVITLIMTMVMSLFIGCGKPADVGTTDPANEEVTQPTGPKILRLAGMPAETFNPHTSDTSETKDLINYMYSTLLDLIVDETGESVEFVPDHAKELPTTEDNIVWTFKLKENIKWTDGTPINAHDYEYSWKMLLDQKLANYAAFVLYDNIPIVNARNYFTGEANWEDVGIKVIDDYTLEITLETAMPEVDVYYTFTSRTTSPVHKEMYEAGMNADRTETTYGTTLASTPSNGTYRLTEWVRDQFRAFDKNEDSIMADIFVPDRIESRVVTENSTRLQLFENGEIDAVSVSGEDYDRYSEDPRLVYNERNSVWGFYVNAGSKTNPILGNNDFRKALYYATNRDAMSKGIFRTFASAPYFISTICLVGDPDSGEKYRDTSEAKGIMPQNYGYDIELAKEYFDKAYEANGNKKITVEITYFDGQDTMKRLAEVAEEEYEKVFGTDKLDITLRAMPPNAAYDTYYEGNFDLGIGARSQNPFNPWSSMKVWTSDFPQKAESFYNKDFDKLYERTTVGDLLLDAEGRLKALVEMEQMLIDEIPMIPIFQNNNAILYQERIHLKTKGKFLPEVGFGVLQSEIVD